MRVRLKWRKPEVLHGVRKAAFVGLWVGGGGALVATVFALSFYFAMRVEMSSTEVRVPDLAGLTLEDAAGRVDPQGLNLQVVDQRHDPAVASGRVLQQAPAAGASVRRGRKVKVILSLGGRVLEVPDLVGQASRTVEIELRQEGFIPGDEARVPSARFDTGKVMAQVPPAQTPAVPNTRVHRLVSDGAASGVWVMPDLTGLNRADAEAWIARSMFRRGTVRRVTMASRAPGVVVGQLPLAGYPVEDRAVVELTVAR